MDQPLTELDSVERYSERSHAGSNAGSNNAENFVSLAFGTRSNESLQSRRSSLSSRQPQHYDDNHSSIGNEDMEEVTMIPGPGYTSFHGSGMPNTRRRASVSSSQMSGRETTPKKLVPAKTGPPSTPVQNPDDGNFIIEPGALVFAVAVLLLGITLFVLSDDGGKQFVMDHGSKFGGKENGPGVVYVVLSGDFFKWPAYIVTVVVVFAGGVIYWPPKWIQAYLDKRLMVKNAASQM